MIIVENIRARKYKYLSKSITMKVKFIEQPYNFKTVRTVEMYLRKVIRPENISSLKNLVLKGEDDENIDFDFYKIALESLEDRYYDYKEHMEEFPMCYDYKLLAEYWVAMEKIKEIINGREDD
jgi:hypothetical protein